MPLQQPTQQTGAQEQPDVLDAFDKRPEAAAALQHLLQLASDPTRFLQPNQQLSEATRQAARVLYGYAGAALLAGVARGERAQLLAGMGAQGASAATPAALMPRRGAALASLLPELCVDAAFDPEQVWVQVEMAGEAALKRARRLVARALPLLQEPEGAGLIKPQHEAAVDALAAGETSSEDEDGDDEEDSDADVDALGSSDEEEEALAAAVRGARSKKGGAGGSRKGARDDGGGSDDEDDIDMFGEGEDEEDEDEDEDGSEEFGAGEGAQGYNSEEEEDAELAGVPPPKRPGQHKRAGKDAVEDKFMKLSDMEAFLEDAERRAAGADDGDDVDGGKGGKGELGPCGWGCDVCGGCQRGWRCYGGGCTYLGHASVCVCVW